MTKPTRTPAMGTSPASVLRNVATSETFDLTAKTCVVAGRRVDADLVLTDPQCSRSQFQIVRHGDTYILEPLSETCPTLCDGQAVTVAEPLRHGCVIEVPGYRFEFLTSAPKPVETILTSPDSISVGELLRDHREYALTRDTLIGRDPSAQIVLSHPTVSRQHTRIRITSTGAELTDLGSANGTYVNGRWVSRRVQLRAGDRLDVGPYQFTFTGRSLVPASRHNNLALIADHLTRTVRDPATGGPRILLDQVSLTIRPGEFVCLLGPSGSGKSTLLAALSARVPADSGKVWLNGTDLYAEFEAVKRDIVVVPQRDCHFDTLSTEQVLRFAARLRLPPDTVATEVVAEVNRLLEAVGLTDQRHTVVRRLSGGQVKRLSLAHELIGDPSLVFLDEVTSGLDEQTDREMMALFRGLADRGKTVVCVTHTMANIEKHCHFVVILAAGGRLAFVGKPEEATAYFGVARLGDVYDSLAQKTPADWKEEFEANPLRARHVVEHAPADLESDSTTETHSSVPRLNLLSFVSEFVRQTWLLFVRNAILAATDRASLAAMLAQCLLVAGVLGLVFGVIPDKPNPLERGQATLNLWFLLGVSCFWFGCNNAARVLVQERPIYLREHAYNLLPSAYLSARFGTLAVVAIVQVLLLVGIIGVWCRPPGLGLCAVGLLFALTAAGTAAGLLLSAVANSEQTAVALIPLVLIPQIVLADALVPLEGVARWLARAFVTVYWGYRGLLAGLPDDDPAAGLITRSQSAINFTVVLAHAVCLSVAAFGILKYRNRR